MTFSSLVFAIWCVSSMLYFINKLSDIKETNSPRIQLRAKLERSLESK